MEKNFLFSAEPAERINQAVQKIDPRLYLFCHYVPLPPTGDLRLDVQTAVMNLYRATVDSIPLWSQLRKCWGYRSKKDKSFNFSPYLSPDVCQVLSEADSLQDHLRGYWAHNNHEANGSKQAGHIKEFTDWQTLATNNLTLDKLQGCQNALQSLLELGNRLEQALLDMVKAMEEAPDRPGIVQAFIDQTICWYTENSRQVMVMDFVDRYLRRTKKQPRNELLRSYLVATGAATRSELNSITEVKEIQRRFFVQAKVDLQVTASMAGSLLPESLLDTFTKLCMPK